MYKMDRQRLVDIASNLMDELDCFYSQGGSVTGAIDGLVKEFHFAVNADMLFSTREKAILKKNGYKIAKQGFYATRKVNGINVEVEKLEHGCYELIFGTNTIWSDSADIYDLKNETRINSRNFKALLKDYINNERGRK